MNVEQVNYVAGISHKGPVLVLHDEYMLEHGTFFLDFTNDLDSQNMFRISVATRNPLQWTNSFKVFGETESFSKSVYQMMWNEAQIYLSCSNYFIIRTWRPFLVPTASDEGLTKLLGDCFFYVLISNLFKVSNLFLNKILSN